MPSGPVKYVHTQLSWPSAGQHENRLPPVLSLLLRCITVRGRRSDNACQAWLIRNSSFPIAITQFWGSRRYRRHAQLGMTTVTRSEEHTSELQSRSDLVCRLLLEKKKKKTHAFICLLSSHRYFHATMSH